MSAIAEIRATIQQELDELMAAIEPLQDALAALGDNGSAPSAEAPAEAEGGSEAAPAAPQAPRARRTRRNSGVTDEAIIDVIKANPNCGASKVREVLPISSNAMSMRLTKLVKSGQLIRMGERRNTHYRVPA